MDMILKNTFQSISPAYELIGDVTVEGTAKTQVDFTGLNIGKDDELLLVVDFINASASGSNLRIGFNNNSALSNYYVQYLIANSTSVSSGRENSRAYIADTTPYNKGFGITNIKLTNSGYVVSQSNITKNYNTTTPELWNSYGTTTFGSLAVITSINLLASITNSIGIGSRFQLYKLVAEKVADIIVPSNTTSVDITGLNIGKDGEYYLVSDIVNGLASGQGVFLTYNGNDTLTNYYYQELVANSSTVTGVRANSQRLTSLTSSKMNYVISNIKLTNNGYGIMISNSNREYSGSNIILYNTYGTSTFTMGSITSFKITSELTNGIGIGSRFQLYKMK